MESIGQSVGRSFLLSQVCLSHRGFFKSSVKLSEWMQLKDTHSDHSEYTDWREKSFFPPLQFRCSSLRRGRNLLTCRTYLRNLPAQAYLQQKCGPKLRTSSSSLLTNLPIPRREIYQLHHINNMYTLNYKNDSFEGTNVVKQSCPDPLSVGWPYPPNECRSKNCRCATFSL